MSSRYLIVTDGRTDRQTDESNLNTALCTSASRGKKVQKWTNLALKNTILCIWRPYWIFGRHLKFEAKSEVAQERFSNSVV